MAGTPGGTPAGPPAMERPQVQTTPRRMAPPPRKSVGPENGMFSGATPGGPADDLFRAAAPSGPPPQNDMPNFQDPYADYNPMGGGGDLDSSGDDGYQNLNEKEEVKNEFGVGNGLSDIFNSNPGGPPVGGTPGGGFDDVGFGQPA